MGNVLPMPLHSNDFRSKNASGRKIYWKLHCAVAFPLLVPGIIDVDENCRDQVVKQKYFKKRICSL